MDVPTAQSTTRGERGSRAGSALHERHVGPRRHAVVHLAWTARAVGAVGGIAEHFIPLRHPADETRDREQHGEKHGGKADRVVYDRGVVVDDWIEAELDEVRVRLGMPIERERDVEEGRPTGHGEY